MDDVKFGSCADIFFGNCENLTDKVKDNSIDLLFTDPPYNIGDKNKLTKVGNVIKSNNEAWGDKFTDKWNSVEEYAEWLLDILKLYNNKLNEESSIILFLDRKYTGYMAYRIEKELGWIFKNKLYFEKNNPLPHCRKNNYRSCIEEAIWFTKNKKYHFNFLEQAEMRQIWKGNIGRKKTNHPTEKYEWMIKPIIERHTYEHDTVLDLFAGSGTIANVCMQLNRNSVSIENKAEYIELIKSRIQI